MGPARALRPALILAAALMLGACGSSESTAPATPAATTTPTAPAAATASTAAATGQPAPSTAEATPAAAPTADTAVDAATPAPDTTPAPDATQAAAPVAEATPSASPTPAPPKATTGPTPREGIDYFAIDPPQPLGTSPGKVEIAEVFSYTCIHCARLDTLIPAWKATLPANVEFVYVPMAHGGFEQVARGFYAAQALGELDRTHTAMFKAFTEQRRGGNGSAADVADIYADLGLDEATVLATMKSFGVNASMARNLKAVPRWGVEGTPTLVVAGKYRVVVTADRGHQGVLDAASWLAQRELGVAGTNPAP